MTTPTNQSHDDIRLWQFYHLLSVLKQEELIRLRRRFEKLELPQMVELMTSQIHQRETEAEYGFTFLPTDLQAARKRAEELKKGTSEPPAG